MSKPKELWAFWAGHLEVYFDKPQKVTYDESTKRWWHKDGNNDVGCKGLTECPGFYLTFASESKEECQKFIDGFMACRSLLSGFFKD